MKLWVLGIVLAVLSALLLAGTREVHVERVGPIELTLEEKALLLERERLATRDARHAQPIDQTQRHEDEKKTTHGLVKLNQRRGDRPCRGGDPGRRGRGRLHVG